MSQQVNVFRSLELKQSASGSAARFLAGDSTTALSYTAGTPPIALYFTNAGTSGSTSTEPFYLKSTLTGAGQVGGRARFHCYSNVASGGWVNALKAYMEFGASGSATGLASALCAETVLSAGTSAGTYCALEAELVLGTSASTGSATSFIYMNATGDGVATFDTNGLLFEVGTGITAGSGKFFQTNTAAAATHALRCKVDGTLYYVMLTSTGA